MPAGSCCNIIAPSVHENISQYFDIWCSCIKALTNVDHLCYLSHPEWSADSASVGWVVGKLCRAGFRHILSQLASWGDSYFATLYARLECSTETACNLR